MKFRYFILAATIIPAGAFAQAGNFIAPLHTSNAPTHTSVAPLHTDTAPMHTTTTVQHTQVAPMHTTTAPAHLTSTDSLTSQGITDISNSIPAGTVSGSLVP